MKRKTTKAVAWTAAAVMAAGMIPAGPVTNVYADETDLLIAANPTTAKDNQLISDNVADGDITSDVQVGIFTIKGTADKGVTVETKEPKIADDGTTFTKRIKLNGSGKSEYRSIHFTADSAAALTVYAMSASGSEDRVLEIYSADGTVVASIPMLASGIQVATVELAAGEYYAASPKSGVNVYGLTLDVKAAGSQSIGFTADELEKKDYTETFTAGDFTIKATAEKGVTVDENAKTATDGETFTQRLKLNGSGKAELRSIHFTAAAAGKLTVYAMSGSSSADRVLGLYSADGTLVAEIPALGAELTGTTIDVAAGEYYLASPSSGVNVYSVKMETAAAGKNISVVADELEKKDYTETFTAGDFTIKAASGKNVTVDENAKTADDGESFTNRIKLNGSGTADVRSIHFTADAASKLTVYAMSGSSSADRVLGLYTADGALVEEIPALGASLTATTVDITAGDYYLASPSSGVNVYAVKVSSGNTEVARADWSSVAAPVIKEVKADGNSAVVSFELLMGDDGADKAEVACVNKAGETVATVMVGKSKDDVKTAVIDMTSSGDYTFTVTAMRNNEEAVLKSEAASLSYVLPLAAPEIRVKNAGDAVLHVEWNAVPEAEKYVVEYTIDGKTTTAAEVTETTADISGLTADKKYAVTVTAVRGEDKNTSAAVEKKAKIEADRFDFTYFGQSISSSVNYMEMIDEDNLTFKLNSCSVKEDGTIDKKGGKFTTFHDGVTYYYTTINPKTENFELTATFTLDYINTTPDGQEGFGLLAMDSLGEYGVASTNHYTNSAAIIATKFEDTVDGVKYTCKDTIGARFVSGIEASEIVANAVTNANCSSVSKAFDYMPENLVKQGESYTLTLKKTNTGYHAIYNGEEFIMYGADKLLQLDSENLYVGFAVARGCNVTVSDVKFTTSDPATDAPAEEEPMEEVTYTAKFDAPSTSASKDYELVFNADVPGTVVIKDSAGKTVLKETKVKAGTDVKATVKLADGKNTYTAEFTPEEGYKPAEKQVLSSYETIKVEHIVNCKSFEGSTIYVSQSGKADGKGTEKSPVDIYTALAYVDEGQTIVLAEGTYELTKSIKIERGNDGTEAARKVLTVANDGRAVLNFSKANGGMQVWGSYWLIENVDICETPGNVKGLQVAGNHNIISQVNAYRNGDTGIQISGTSAETIEKWPSYNLILNCTSYDNCDPGMNNADGFAAKITCGEGNVFRGCIAHNNLDDGWDLFAKTESGPIGAVTIENCIAYANGTLTNGTGNGDGNGFKLGGDGIPGKHVLRNSISFNNNTAGITSNSNPSVILENNISYGNKGMNITLYSKGTITREFVATGNISMNGGAEDNYSEMPSLASENNYFFTGGKCANASGTVLTKDIFVSTDMSKLPVRAKDGSIEMNGLLELTDAAPSDAGARLVSTALSDDVRPEVTDKKDDAGKKDETGKKDEAGKTDKEEVKFDGDYYVVKSGDYLRKIAESIFGKEAQWKDIYEANKDIISNPDMIHIGMKLRIKK